MCLLLESVIKDGGQLDHHPVIILDGNLPTISHARAAALARKIVGLQVSDKSQATLRAANSHTTATHISPFYEQANAV